MNTSTTMLLAATAVVLTACNPPDPNRTTEAPPGVNHPTAVVKPLITPSAPPAEPERGPVAASANTAAPGTDAAAAFSNSSSASGSALPSTAVSSLPPPRGDNPVSQETAVNAQEAAAAAPNTAAADAAAAAVKAAATDGPSGQRMSGTASDTSANSPRHGSLTKQEESVQMPKAGQANNHSSPALEADSGARKP